MSQYNNHIEKSINLFKSYLLASGKSRITVKNYLSDIRYFLGWFYGLHKATYAELHHGLENITKNVVLTYRLFLIESHIPKATINRRLSSLRFFVFALHDKGIISEDPSSSIKTVTSEPSPTLDFEANMKKQIHQLVSEYGSLSDDKSHSNKQGLLDISDFFSSILSDSND